MADENRLSKDLAELVSRHGVSGLSSEMTRGPKIANPIGSAASYIKEIITGDQAFDEQVLSRVVGVLKQRN